MKRFNNILSRSRKKNIKDAVNTIGVAIGLGVAVLILSARAAPRES